ncbi:MAG: FAD-binding oxidoreductase [Thermodesulfobacteriota bacterium]
MADYHFDYLFVGGGILGSSSAYALSKSLGRMGESASIAVVDIDLEGEHSSTLKNAGGVRATWRNNANIQLCKYSINFYETIKDKLQFRQHGYKWLHNEASWREMQGNLERYKEFGVNVELYDPNKVTEHLPFVDNIEGVRGLSISGKSGLLDHYSLREYYRKEAKSRGVTFLDRIYINDVIVKDDKAEYLTGYDLSELIRSYGDTSDFTRAILESERHEFGANSISIEFNNFINTSGAWGPLISSLYGFEDKKIKPRKRQIVIMNSQELDLINYGMIIDTSDIYFHQESQNILAGYSNKDEPYGYNFDFTFGGMDENSMFVKYIWEPLWKRISRLERVKFIRGWAGIYAETTDRSGYLGLVPGFQNIYENIGHTGRGLMISYGAGFALADLILTGEFRDELKYAIDLSRDRPSGQLYEELHL